MQYGSKQLIPELQMGLRQSGVRRIIHRLPIRDSLAALDFMLRDLWEGQEYSSVRTRDLPNTIHGVA
jgi:hypothetical protein